MNEDLPLAAARSLIALALEEDRVRDDATVRALVDEETRGVAEIVARASGVACGMPFVPLVFESLDPDARVQAAVEDGTAVAAGTCLCRIEGQAGALLGGERTALNLVGRLSGVASTTARFVEGVVGTGARVLDTRKTTPGWRALEKYAVRTGGGHNHRMDLADAAMIKENHLEAAFGGRGPEAVKQAVRRCRERLPDGAELYVEVEDLSELEAALEAGADVIMIDDFDLGDARAAARRLRQAPTPRPVLEATGGIDADNIGSYAAAGIGRISLGALTHSAPWLDVSMRLKRAASARGG